MSTRTPRPKRPVKDEPDVSEGASADAPAGGDLPGEQTDQIATAPATVHVVCASPHGPVHVGDGQPLTHTQDRVVPDSPLVRAYIAAGTLVVVEGDTTPGQES